MSSQERLEKISVFVKDHLGEMARQHPSPEHDPVYRWDHTLRVAQYGEQVAEAEGADVEALKVDTGGVVFDETLLVTGVATFTVQPTFSAATTFAKEKGANEGVLLDYSTSAKVTGDKECVGYASMVFV